uniref:Uncharacterized protein n=1 Tax=Oryza sativa subsp. japonica TaxID=39947 RepID=Q6H675_ORYSJ|nr:hypothetical protein [Oryza sativa Japonica Group]BAD25774.1 hypothetical protein [Oryza sativa Japonica Group]
MSEQPENPSSDQQIVVLLIGTEIRSGAEGIINSGVPSLFSLHTSGHVWHSSSSNSTPPGAGAQPNSFSSTKTGSGAGWSSLTK